MIKILFVHFNSELTGSDISLFNHVKWLNKKKFLPVVVLPYEGPLVKKYQEIDVKVLFSPMTKARRNIYSILNYILRFPFEIYKIVKIIHSEQPDLVHTNDLPNLHGPIAAKLSGVKHVQHIRKYVLKPRIIYDILSIIAIALSDRIIVVSEANLSNLSSIGRKVGKFVIVHNGVDIEEYFPKEHKDARIKHNISDEVLVIGNISNFGHMKGQDAIIRIAAAIKSEWKDVLFVFMGATDTEGFFEIKSIINELSLEDCVRIYNNSENVPEIMSLIDIFIFPSLRESFPRTIIEAMAMGKAIISNDVGGIREAIKDGTNGILVKPERLEHLKEAVMKLIVDHDLRIKIGNQAYEDCRRFFDIRKTTNDIEAIYMQIA